MMHCAGSHAYVAPNLSEGQARVDAQLAGEAAAHQIPHAR